MLKPRQMIVIEYFQHQMILLKSSDFIEHYSESLNYNSSLIRCTDINVRYRYKEMSVLFAKHALTINNPTSLFLLSIKFL